MAITRPAATPPRCSVRFRPTPSPRSPRAPASPCAAPTSARLPVVVAAEGEQIAIAYGPAAAARALASGSGPTLADDPVYKEAVKALGGTPITGFADGPAALKLASSLIAGTDDQDDFEDAKPYLAKIEYLAIGSDPADGLATATLIAGLAK